MRSVIKLSLFSYLLLTVFTLCIVVYPCASIASERFLSFTSSEKNNYSKQENKCKFKTPEEEYEWSKTQKKTCSKCSKEKSLNDFGGNTSGTDAFNKNGYRLRRPECRDCTILGNKGKSEAKKKANELNIPYKAPEGTLCGICNKSNNLVFDHCHKNNTFRGYCCNSCNRSIGVLGDDVPGLLNAINYLLKTEKCTITQNEKGELKYKGLDLKAHCQEILDFKKG